MVALLCKASVSMHRQVWQSGFSLQPLDCASTVGAWGSQLFLHGTTLPRAIQFVVTLSMQLLPSVQPMVVGIAAMLQSVTLGALKPAELEDIIASTVIKKPSLTEKCATGVSAAVPA